jgi:hypothetical protein
MYKIGFKPSTGLQILSLMDLLKRDVNIFGFDWKKTPTIYDEKRTQDPHNYFIEKKIALNLIRKNNWNLF